MGGSHHGPSSSPRGCTRARRRRAPLALLLPTHSPFTPRKCRHQWPPTSLSSPRRPSLSLSSPYKNQSALAELLPSPKLALPLFHTALAGAARPDRPPLAGSSAIAVEPSAPYLGRARSTLGCVRASPSTAPCSTLLLLPLRSSTNYSNARTIG
jgi:hypothetical protein